MTCLRAPGTAARLKTEALLTGLSTIQFLAQHKQGKRGQPCYTPARNTQQGLNISAPMHK